MCRIQSCCYDVIADVAYCKNFTTDRFEFIKGLFKGSQFLLLQELWLYESEFHNLLKLDNNCDFIATSSMNEYTQRVGQPYYGTPLLNDKLQNQFR